ncbi:hypothetical protein NXT3_PC00322 (plasmid) [Sinorhizobium fredii]|uniref:Uncharacterized protein n=1 Tax=Rhizobium fredii TaxID=380 RepID=A0A2L0HDC4_RHIFR|nr:hypothetical protein NXT3_PC00322 [Sinorhizobium fredii]
MAILQINAGRYRMFPIPLKFFWTGSDKWWKMLVSGAPDYEIENSIFVQLHW